MAIYLHLPVYKASYDLLVELFKFTKDFNREYKYTLGESILRKKMLAEDLPPHFSNYVYISDDYAKPATKN